MIRKMRRNKQELTKEVCIAILERNTSGVLALSGNDRYPYAVPLSYVYSQNKLLFHSAKEGHKLSVIKQCENASFCVIDKDDVMTTQYTMLYRSVIAFGKVRILENEKDIKQAMQLLAYKYHPQDSEANRNSIIHAAGSSYLVLEFTIEAMSGKQSRELAEPMNG